MSVMLVTSMTPAIIIVASKNVRYVANLMDHVSCVLMDGRETTVIPNSRVILQRKSDTVVQLVIMKSYAWQPIADMTHVSNQSITTTLVLTIVDAQQAVHNIHKKIRMADVIANLEG